MNHLGDDKQCFPRNWRNLTLNTVAQIHFSQSSYSSSWRFQCYQPYVFTLAPIFNLLQDVHLLPALLPFHQAWLSLFGSQARCCVLWLQDKALPPRKACKCFPVIGFLRNMLERKLLSPSQVGARDFTGSQISLLVRFNSTQHPLKC